MAGGRRFYIRYAIQRWDDAKWFVGSFIVVLAVLLGYRLAQGRVDYLFLSALCIEVLFLAGVYLFRRLAYLEVLQDRLLVRYGFQRAEIPVAVVTRVRKQPLQAAFQQPERRRYLNRFVRRLLRQPAAFIRIDRREPELLDLIRARLGARMVHGPDLVLPITDLDAFLSMMKVQLRSTE
jgi:hypothetical protein